MSMKELLTVQEVADLPKTSRQQVCKMIQNGALPAIRIGREWRIDPQCSRRRQYPQEDCT